MLLAGTAAVLFDGGDWMPHFRFMGPLIPLLYLCVQESIRTASRGAGRLVASQPRRTLAQAGVALALGGAVFGAALWASIDKAEQVHAHPFAAPYSLVESRAERLQALAACLGNDRASVLTPDIGAIAYKTDLLVIDILGLGDAYIAREDPTLPELANYVLGKRRPDIIATHSHLFGLDFDPRFERDYMPAVMEYDAFGLLTNGFFVRRTLAAGHEQCLEVAPGPGATPL
jgi:hypothetical protein